MGNPKLSFRIACLLSMAVFVPGGSAAVARSNRLLTSQAVVNNHASLVVNARPNRISVTIYNTGATRVLCGSADVTATSGVPLPADLGHGITFDTSDEIYCLCPSGLATVGAAEIFR